ncbi:MAG: class I SAM-dependent RNA methyltransferase [Hyphomonadaceae bacterium]
MTVEIVEIEALGAQGDGVGSAAGRRVFVPLAAPGDRVSARIEGNRGVLLEVVEPGPDRVTPSCAHYGTCGGCQLQHLSREAYLSFKQDLVRSALAAHGMTPEIEPIWAVEPRTRRRAVFAAHRRDGEIEIGFHGRRSHRIEAIEACEVITPGLLASLPALKRAIAPLCPAKDGLTVTVAETASGLDVAVNGADPKLDADRRQRAIGLGAEAGFARLSMNGDVLAQWRTPALRTSHGEQEPAPGGFLQACASAEARMVEEVLAGVGKAKTVADLFAGSGTFSLPLAGTASVHAVEGDGPALEALQRSLKRAPSGRPATTERRDLFRRPLLPDELARFAAVVLDPPRAGAEAQVRMLARSRAKTVVMVSCNAQSFARDMKILTDGGYKVRRIQPVDQFLYTPHVEIVATLAR